MKMGEQSQEMLDQQAQRVFEYLGSDNFLYDVLSVAPQELYPLLRHYGYAPERMQAHEMVAALRSIKSVEYEHCG